tara:strand:- start:7 stop:738 length:732 start_codon:yes stop_codon:yes gene_type:complete
MQFNFATYTEMSLRALQFNPKSQEVVDRKKEILQTITTHHGKTPSSILFYGFNPLILISQCENISVTEITDATKKYLADKKVKYTYIDEKDLGEYDKSFDWVVACDEYFTFANSEDHQLGKVQKTSKLVKDLLVTTFRDYKNQDFRDREFSHPLAVRRDGNSKVFLEHHNHTAHDRNAWETMIYEMNGQEVSTDGPHNRRSMFFKQMAKFSLDAGGKNFYVHKNLMYKSLIKKNYEHVISISY